MSLWERLFRLTTRPPIFEGIAVGDRVVAEQIVPCWKCRYCVNGEYWMCAPHDMFGFKRRTPGGMAEYMVYNKDALVWDLLRPSTRTPRPHEPLSCALHAVERADIKFEDVVVVAGCGLIGLGMIAGAKSRIPRRLSPSIWLRTSWKSPWSAAPM